MDTFGAIVAWFLVCALAVLFLAGSIWACIWSFGLIGWWGPIIVVTLALFILGLVAVIAEGY